MGQAFRLNDPNDNGVFGGNDSNLQAPAGGSPVGNGVFGFSNVPNASGVFGANNNGGNGVVGVAHGNGDGVQGFADNGAGVIGRSNKNAVIGVTASDTDAGVNGGNTGKGFGVFGGTVDGHGVEGHSTNGIGVVGFSDKGLAGRFIGNVEVTGDIRLANAGDCAEDFDIANADLVEAGTVMVLGEGGILEPSQFAYDKRVAGVISGAGNYKPGIVLDKQQTETDRKPVALLGKVYCKVDASYAPIAIGDLLTSSDSVGRAMKVNDPGKAFGAVIGKALQPLAAGQGLIPILIALQ